jgi:Flp pilus assembly protein TadB
MEQEVIFGLVLGLIAAALTFGAFMRPYARWKRHQHAAEEREQERRMQSARAEQAREAAVEIRHSRDASGVRKMEQPLGVRGRHRY